MILSSIILARQIYYRDSNKSSEAIKESERKSNVEIMKRRTQMLMYNNGENSIFKNKADSPTGLIKLSE